MLYKWNHAVYNPWRLTLSPRDAGMLHAERVPLIADHYSMVQMDSLLSIHH